MGIRDRLSRAAVPCRVALLAAWLVGMAPAALRSQDPRQLTAEESVRLGLQQNARLRAAQADAAEAQAALRQVRATRLPALRSQASYLRLGGEIPEAEFTLPGFDTTFTLLPIERNRYHTELSLEQPLFTGGRLQNQVRAAALEADAAELLARQEAADVAFEVRRAFWNLSGAIAARDALDVSLLQVDEHLRGVRLRVDAGAALTSELLAAQTRRSEVLLERVEAENAVRVGQLELNQRIGLPLATPVQPADSGAVEPLPPDAGSLAARALAERPQLRALDAQVRALRAQLVATQGAWWPQLALTGRYVYARPNPYALTEQDQFRGTWEAGVVLQWSLWEGGQRPARTSQARARLQGAEARLVYAREQAVVEVTRQYLEVRRAGEAVEVAALNVREAEETFRVVRQQFDEGVALSAQVLDAERAFRTAQSRRARSLADYAIARAALLQSLGQVW